PVRPPRPPSQPVRQPALARGAGACRMTAEPAVLFDLAPTPAEPVSGVPARRFDTAAYDATLTGDGYGWLAGLLPPPPPACCPPPSPRGAREAGSRCPSRRRLRCCGHARPATHRRRHDREPAGRGRAVACHCGGTRRVGPGGGRHVVWHWRNVAHLRVVPW